MGNVPHVIFRYFIDTQTGVVSIKHLLLHKGDTNNVLPIACCSVPRYRYCVSCGVYHGAPVCHSGPTVLSTFRMSLNFRFINIFFAFCNILCSVIS